MTKRIEAIYKRITPSDVVLDIGCDMAHLGEMLAREKIHSYASDVRSNIIDRARSRIESLELDEYITFIVSDGLENINYKVDTLVLAGMGAYTIIKILKKAREKYKKIITVSNNNHDVLRLSMHELGYTIKEEEIIIEKGKYYNLIEFTQGKCAYTKEEILIGKNHINKKNLKEYNEMLLDKYTKLPKKSDKLKELIDVLNCYKY